MADVQQQLSTLLGTRVKQLRTTEESPPNISVIDVVAAITGLSSSNAAVAFTRLKNEHPDVTARCSHVKFRDSRGRRGQKDSPACDVRGIVEIIMLLPGRHRRSFAPAFSLTVQVVEGSAPTSLPGSAAFDASDWGFGSPPRGEGLRIFCPLSGAQEEEAQGRGQSRGLR